MVNSIRKAFPPTVDSEKKGGKVQNKKLGIILPKEDKGNYGENYKTTKRTIEESENSPMFEDWEN